MEKGRRIEKVEGWKKRRTREAWGKMKGNSENGGVNWEIKVRNGKNERRD